MASRRAVAGTTLIGIGLIGALMDVTPGLWELGGLYLPVLGIPAGIASGLLVLSAPENREHRGPLVGALAAGSAIALGGFLLALQGLDPPESGPVAFLLSFVDTVFFVAFTAILGSVWFGLGSLSRRWLPQAHPWLLVPAPMLWGSIGTLTVLADAGVPLLAHGSALSSAVEVALVGAALAAVVGLLGALQLRQHSNRAADAT